MRLRWNEESKKLLLGLGLFLVLSLALGNLGISFYQNRMRSEYNLLAANMIETVQKAYPQASETELIACSRLTILPFSIPREGACPMPMI